MDNKKEVEIGKKGKENNKDIYILGIETSCDETSAAVVKNGRELLSNIIMHVEAISVVIKKALEEANITMNEVSAIAVTEGPGLVGALLVRSIICKRTSVMHIIRKLYQ